MPLDQEQAIQGLQELAQAMIVVAQGGNIALADAVKSHPDHPFELRVDQNAITITDHSPASWRPGMEQAIFSRTYSRP